MYYFEVAAEFISLTIGSLSKGGKKLKITLIIPFVAPQRISRETRVAIGKVRIFRKFLYLIQHFKIFRAVPLYQL